MPKTRERLGDKITIALQEMICSNYKQGDKIPNEEELSKLFSVSRITIREAITNLKSKGLLLVKQGDGTYVDSPSTSSFIKPILPILRLNNTDIADIFEVRALIETQAIKSAATKGITTEESNHFDYLLEKMEQAAIDKNIEKYDDYDLEFHRFIVHCSRNEILATIHELLLDLVKETIQKGHTSSEHIVNSIIYHNRLKKEIASNNAQDAVTTLEQHLNDGLAFIKENKNNQ